MGENNQQAKEISLGGAGTRGVVLEEELHPRAPRFCDIVQKKKLEYILVKSTMVAV